ncbi:multiprotein-bridging factor 1 family protein [Micromonospora krabiensis]|uniref:Helix-turn-helix domain-containing protein n=1 Tax=Micromonospora krabiensis TaxID=307121 RepID=A0A1C3NA38_9ACTN|nr:helix-turn-helix transcriptional regulator [Micromonospora krabiensis]SBV29431.1 Helix-turn-helix domain-containing protein [Micromonospora krabiensis]
MASALDPPPTGPTVGPFPIAGLVRRARRITGLGQRQMARFAKVAPSTVGRVEAGTMTPSLEVLERLLGAAGLYLAVVDQDGRVVQPMGDWEDIRDGAGRRYPSHLNTILDPEPGEWWADIYGLARPPETFLRSQHDREVRRRRSQWEVPVAKYRNVPPPPDPRAYD